MTEINVYDVGLLTFLAGHLGTAFWFASSLSTKIGFIFEKIQDIDKRISKLLNLQERMAVCEIAVEEVRRRVEDLESER